MAFSFVYAPPSNEFRAKSKSPLKWTEYNQAVLFRELLLLARTYSSGRCWNEASQFSLFRTHVKNYFYKNGIGSTFVI
jgi:hypothetical protein